MAQRARAPQPTGIAPSILLQIVRAEDQRRWDDSLKSLLSHNDARVRVRAALAAGRIGAQGAVEPLADLLLTDRVPEVRQMAAFALGELELPGGAFALMTAVKDPNNPGRARALEALGKISAAFPTRTAGGNAATPQDDRLDIINAEILNTLRFEDGRRALRLEDNRRAQPDRLAILFGLTAVLRSRPEGVSAGPILKRFLDYEDARIVADALNTLARLRLKDGNEDARRLLVKHADPIVRANSARVLGATDDKQSFDALLDRALHDSDSRVGVSAIRALGSLKDQRAAAPLIERGEYLLRLVKVSPQYPIEPRNELLEIATALGAILQNTNSQPAMDWLSKVREQIGYTHAPVEIAFARIAPQRYVANAQGMRVVPASVAQALGEIANGKTGQEMADANNREGAMRLIDNALACASAKRPTPEGSLPLKPAPGKILKFAGTCKPLDTLVVPDALRSYARLKGPDLNDVLLKRLKNPDVIVRATAAELLAEQPANEANSRALIEALPRALADRDLNDAALALLDALGKQKTAPANEAIKSALNSSDYLIRQKAVALLKANGAGDFSGRIGTVQTRNTEADYRRAIARMGKKVTATVVTNKGAFTIEFLPVEAPLTVDNFVQLARRRYFNGQTVPRVVPNFVIQTGDPRGDQNGGPGYQIRCEINEVPYDRAAVGMALSGKDTGGSQWFVTHSPQPHLDGGYTVFGRVISGMDVVDRIARGDTIRNVVINER
jgi:cyclophilin family peptidyl-prolyl cis-trans isomerase/HEAT repeat protein